MAIKLFRKGGTHVVDGIECEIRLFDVKYGHSFVGIDGWCADINDLIEVEEERDEYSPSEIRELAKKAGIDGWENKRINTLKEVLSGQDTQD